uniref:Nascent polypeptide-associated complex subunit alpha-like UBA domain-containing protein n=1 Tax=Polytomella parva TaxID=51329 RepID=A0A7S0YQP6_9CHLO|mmetsp:Transcript_8212/g.15859  ORF Transcript_8212/g.15859 Transcript_8212/m.15859 type:complete len:114 (+) Transcript_8212:78-419(+)|eukprot:CAMPEP_0175064168 /NCGR_PEP_ID=MMETSP0052_2-20121109/15171_1 /TAXON_ID=51329 ORGANISM="Polytomella parva, Strain SAG 63-3" /NCGR_SAMPLE_ID=MMETSP0052_2 /ASSEMBLY_ACC=CAM_ASM_000194 /LENGTH=113 /DNA_ID=CAMNT_0016330465 /DNA_START=18 /DNA_END=359 /DNA_ORIENTATION=+
MEDDALEIEAAPEDLKDRQGREQAAAMGKLADTDNQEMQIDANKVNKAMLALAAAQKASKVASLEREKELASVVIHKADIDVIANEFEIDKKQAERRLRECNGNLRKALESYL